MWHIKGVLNRRRWFIYTHMYMYMYRHVWELVDLSWRIFPFSMWLWWKLPCPGLTRSESDIYSDVPTWICSRLKSVCCGGGRGYLFIDLGWEFKLLPLDALILSNLHTNICRRKYSTAGLSVNQSVWLDQLKLYGLHPLTTPTRHPQARRGYTSWSRYGWHVVLPGLRCGFLCTLVTKVTRPFSPKG